MAELLGHYISTVISRNDDQAKLNSQTGACKAPRLRGLMDRVLASEARVYRFESGRRHMSTQHISVSFDLETTGIDFGNSDQSVTVVLEINGKEVIVRDTYAYKQMDDILFAKVKRKLRKLYEVVKEVTDAI